MFSYCVCALLLTNRSLFHLYERFLFLFSYPNSRFNLWCVELGGNGIQLHFWWEYQWWFYSALRPSWCGTFGDGTKGLGNTGQWIHLFLNKNFNLCRLYNSAQLTLRLFLILSILSSKKLGQLHWSISQVELVYSAYYYLIQAYKGSKVEQLPVWRCFGDFLFFFFCCLGMEGINRNLEIDLFLIWQVITSLYGCLLVCHVDSKSTKVTRAVLLNAWWENIFHFLVYHWLKCLICKR